MTGKLTARVSALSLAFLLAACGGGGDSTPLAPTSPGNPSTPPTTPGEPGEDGSDPEAPGFIPSLALGSVNSAGEFVFDAIGSEFTELTIGAERTGSVRLNLMVVDPGKGPVPVVEQGNSVTFFSGCLSSGWANIDNTTVNAEAGVAYARYTPGELCVGEDTIFARLNNDNEILASVTVTNTSATGLPSTSAVQVGSFNDAGVFQEGQIRVMQPALTLNANGEASTDLIVNVLEDGEIAIGRTYTTQFTSMCLDAGRASVTGTNSTSSGAVLATYNAAPDCLGTDHLIVFVDGGGNQLKATADIFVSDTALALGSYDSADMFIPSLSASSNALDYDSQEEPTTEIRSVIAKVDSSGAFISPLVGFERNIEFFSTCIDSGLASIQSTGSTESGELISTYTAQGCVGADTIYGRIAGTEEFVSTTVTIAAKEGQSLALGHFGTGSFNQGVIGNTRATALPLGVQTKLYLSIVDIDSELQIKGQPLSVQLTSQCGELPGNESPLSVSSASVSLGYLEVLYTAQSCGELGQDLVIAELTGLEGVTAKAEAVIELAALPANSLTAGIPAPNSIAPSWYSTEGRETESSLQVQLRDNQGNGVANQVISFRLDNPGTTDVAVLEPVNGGTTNASGFAEVKIKAKEGFDNVVFRVIASYRDADGNLLETYSAPIAVNSKLPFAERFSLSTSNFAPDTQGRDGVQVQLTLLAADDEGNRIRGNTVVNFTTDQGSIDPECVLDDEGRCTVTWESLGIAGITHAGVTAYTHGRRSDGSTGRIEDSTQMLMSTSQGIRVSLNPRTIPADGGPICAEAWVDILSSGGRNSPPVGTTLDFEAVNGTLLPSSSNSFTLGSSSELLGTPYSFLACTYFEPDPDRTEDAALTVTVTPPNGLSAFERISE